MAQMVTTKRPVGPAGDADWWRRLKGFELRELAEKTIEEDEIEDESVFDQAFAEFKKYVALVRWTNDSLAMTSQRVDAVWHQFILFTRQYHAFCDEFLGRYLHHAPATASSPLPPDARATFRAAYERHFGRLDPIWNDHADGGVGDCKADCNCEPGKCSS